MPINKAWEIVAQIQTKTDHLLSCLRGSFLPQKVTIIWLRQPQLHGKCFFQLEIRVRKTQTDSRRDSQIMKSTGNGCQTFTAWQIFGWGAGGGGFTVLPYIWMKNSSPREGLDIKNIVSSSGGNLGVPCSCVPLLYSLQERSLPVSFWPVKVDVLDARWSNLLEIIVGELQGKTSKGDCWLGTIEVRGGYSYTLPIRVCAVQRGRDFEAPDLERGILFRGVF